MALAGRRRAPRRPARPRRQRRRGRRRRGPQRLPHRQPRRGRRLPLRRSSTSSPSAVDLDEVFRQLSHTEDDFVDVKGQDYAKRALLIAAAGSHNILMIGPPGTGKTLLAKRLPTILPPLTPPESLETTRIYSAMGLLKPGQPLMAVRPFRPPHHSVSDAGLVGGGSTPQPGEISPGAQGRPVPRRDARVQPQDARGPPAAAGGGLRDDQPGPAEHDLPGRVHPGGGDEPLPVRVSIGPAAGVQLHAAAGGEVPQQDLRPAAGPDRPARRGAGGAVHATGRDAARADLGRAAGAGARGAWRGRRSGSARKACRSTAG